MVKTSARDVVHVLKLAKNIKYIQTHARIRFNNITILLSKFSRLFATFLEFYKPLNI